MSRHDLDIYDVGDVLFVARHRVSEIVRIWLRRVSTRAQLRDLDPSRLADIGVSHDDRTRECGKWWWET
jgi:uncharacterized protein YjiS (DUF1127 family)